jgi:hypothetical protein
MEALVYIASRGGVVQQQPFDRDRKTCFFVNFSGETLFRRLVGFAPASWQEPVAVPVAMLLMLDEEDLTVMEYRCLIADVSNHRFSIP